MVLAFPVLNEAYSFLPIIDIPVYNIDQTFYFWFGKSLGTIALLVAMRISIGKWDNPVFRYGWYFVLFYGFYDLYLTLPLSETYGHPWAYVFASFFVLATFFIGPSVMKLLSPSELEKWKRANEQSKKDLERQKKLAQYLEYNADELQRLLRAVDQDDVNKIILAQAYMVKVFKQSMPEPEMQDIFYQKAQETAEAIRSIKRKTSSYTALKPDE